MPAVPRAASAWPSEALFRADDRARAPGHGRTRSVIARLVRSADFERVLRTRTRASSAHFALHHVPDSPSTPAKPVTKPANPSVSTELSTGVSPVVLPVVDDSALAAPLDALWLGTVVPKRHAKRAVTRTLMKRQIRRAVDGHEGALSAGLWVVRLRAPFDSRVFVSAASDALKRSVRAELEGLLASALQPRGARR
jgi:ribonuclease P protein component